ncbi:hypothetical protein Adu01nite_74160 [Paractinoplanes durhamensis]|uniref:Uncharacterized protein n=1 Tax=Paractinoplanes durhamensis TaxID=113563 RepID=A0ABQ3Z8H3_9ACTN|nr:hypothetical protein Adu01nite_74160 [Actinoplanes durhamensis]
MAERALWWCCGGRVPAWCCGGRRVPALQAAPLAGRGWAALWQARVLGREAAAGRAWGWGGRSGFATYAERRARAGEAGPRPAPGGSDGLYPPLRCDILILKLIGKRRGHRLGLGVRRCPGTVEDRLAFELGAAASVLPRLA